jgi:hypothetical protein
MIFLNELLRPKVNGKLNVGGLNADGGWSDQKCELSWNLV